MEVKENVVNKQNFIKELCNASEDANMDTYKAQDDAHSIIVWIAFEKITQI